MNATTETFRAIRTADEILAGLGASGGSYFGGLEVNLAGNRVMRITTQDDEGHLRLTITENGLIVSEVDINGSDRAVIALILSGLVR